MIPRIFSIIILSASFLLSSCFSVKPSASGKAGGLYETFFVGEGITQYFIKPLDFKQVNGKSDLKMDFTFRVKKSLQDSAIINFTIISPIKIEEINQLTFNTKTVNFSASPVKTLYKEREKRKYKRRFSLKVHSAKIRTILSTQELYLIVSIGQKKQNTKYLSTNRTDRHLRKLNNILNYTLSE